MNKLKMMVNRLREIYYGFWIKDETPDWLKNEPLEGEEVVPPWIQYPNQAFWWGGWRQGYSEHWLLRHWFPFWNRLMYEERKAYIKRWPPPDNDWSEWIEKQLFTDWSK